MFLIIKLNIYTLKVNILNKDKLLIYYYLLYIVYDIFTNALNIYFIFIIIQKNNKLKSKYKMSIEKLPFKISFLIFKTLLKRYEDDYTEYQ